MRWTKSMGTPKLIEIDDSFKKKQKQDGEGDRQRVPDGRARSQVLRRQLLVLSAAALHHLHHTSRGRPSYFTEYFKVFFFVKPPFDFTRFYRVLPVFFTGLYWVWPGLTGFDWVLLGFNGFYWVLQGFTWFYWVWLGLTGFDWVLLVYTRFCFAFAGYS